MVWRDSVSEHGRGLFVIQVAGKCETVTGWEGGFAILMFTHNVTQVYNSQTAIGSAPESPLVVHGGFLGSTDEMAGVSRHLAREEYPPCDCVFGPSLLLSLLSLPPFLCVLRVTPVRDCGVRLCFVST